MNIRYEKELKELYKYSDIDLLRFFKNTPDSLAFFPLARRLFQKSKFIEVVQILQLGLKNYSDLYEASILLSKAYSKLDLNIEAVNTLNKLIVAAPRYALSYYYLSEILYKQNLSDKAEVLLLKAYELDSNDPDIKNSFQLHFSTSYDETVEGMNVSEILEHTVAESLDDIKKRSNNTNHEIESIQDDKLDFFEKLEKEFEYNKSKKWYYIFIVAILISVIGITLFLTLRMTEKEKTNNYKKEMISLLNSNLSMKTINQTINNKVFLKLKDITEYYQLLYHYQKDYTKFLNTVEEIKKRTKFKSEWEYLSKMTYHLYEGNDMSFDELYKKIIINKKYNKNPDIFMLKAHQFIKNKDMLNATSYLNDAFKKSNKAERFKIELAMVYTYQHNFIKIKELFVDTIPISDEGDMFLELSRVKADKDRILILEKYIKKIPQRLTKRKLIFLLAKLYLDNKEPKKSQELLTSLPDVSIPYYNSLKKIFLNLKFKK